MTSLPFVSFIIPTYNAQRYLEQCLKSIQKQNYPKGRYEVFVVDGGSTDRTLEIVKRFNVQIIHNPRRDPETAKSLGIQRAKGESIVLMDSDNIIIKSDWLSKMVRPLVMDPTLFGVESFYFPKKGESIFNTYSMILHIADPFSRCLAGRLISRKMNGYIEYTIQMGSTYPLGANGFLWNKKVIEDVGLYKPKFEESNFSFFAMEKGYRKFARVPGYGIYHHHIESIFDFVQKRLKIGNKFLDRKDEKRKTWLEGISRMRFFLSAIYCFSIIGPLIEALFEFIRTKNKAWLLHPLMAFISVSIYSLVFIKRKL